MQAGGKGFAARFAIPLEPFGRCLRMQGLIESSYDTETGEGSLFGFVVDSKGIHYVDDGENTLNLLH